MTGLAIVAGPAAAEEQAGLLITKSASVDTVEPGDAFSYTIQVSCIYSGSITPSGCVNATVSDVVPAQFSVTSVLVTNYSDYLYEPAGNDVSVVFTSAFLDPVDGIGMIGGSTATVTINVIADNLSYEDDAQDIENTATFSADNPNTPPASDTATVVPTVPLTLDTDVTKAFRPESGIASAGEPTTIDISALNTSDAGVDSLVVTEPADPTATPNPFDTLAFDSLTISQFPAGADTVQVDVYTAGGWVNGTPGPAAVIPGGVDPDDVRGVRVTFTSSTGTISPDPDGEAIVSIDVTQRDQGTIDGDITVPNTVQSDVSRDGMMASDTGDATYTILGNVPDVDATKTFDPQYVAHGGTSDATITAQNTWTDSVTDLSVVEPAVASGASVYDPGFSDAMTFEGFASAPVWPAGATGASITYYYADGTDETDSFAEGDLPPDPTGTGTVVRFSVDFTGDIDPGAEATVVPTLGTDPDDPAAVTEIVNTVTGTATAPSGATGTDDASDSFLAYLPHVDPVTDKTITPNTILGYSGEWVVLQLPSGPAPLPSDPNNPVSPYSTSNANTIVVQDPLPQSDTDDTPQQSDFWDAFNPTEISDTVVPADSSLQVNYWDGDAWVPLAGPIDGATTWSYDIAGEAPPAPEDIGGLQFVFTNPAPNGFQPGDTVQPNIVMDFDPTANVAFPATIENCSGASVSALGAAVSPGAEACDSVLVVDPDDPDGPGVGDIVDKQWQDQTIGARTRDEATARILWSTGGYSNADSVTLTDIPNPTSDTTDSVYDAFDLVRVNAITPATDQYIAYDAVQSVQLFNGTSWVEASNSPCGTTPAACAGQLPEIALTAAEQDSTLAVRLVFIESPNRVDDTDPLSPPVGSGVARSIDNTRPVDLTFQIRDYRRSDPTTAVTADEVYNVVDETGDVRNTVNATADFTDRDDISQYEFDDIVITYVPFDVSATKTWQGGPVGIPPTGTDEEDYPSTRVTLEATNDSLAYADTMRIADPAAFFDETSTGADANGSPFDYFNLTGFVSITPPDSADLDIPVDGVGDATTLVTVFRSGTIPLTGDIATALAWTKSDLANAIGVEVTYDGRIEPASTGTVVFDLQLRTEVRGTTEPVDDDDIDHIETNLAGANLDDDGMSQADLPFDTASAAVRLTEFVIGMTVEKGFAPIASDTPDPTGFVQTEPTNDEFVMTLTGFPVEGARATQMEIRDVDPTFWNVYEFVGFDPSFDFAQPIDRIKVDAVVDGTFVGDLGGALTVTNQDTIPGVADTAPALPTGVEAADVQGLVLTYTRDDGAQWENSEEPHQSIPIIVKRRDVMLTGDEPPTDLPGNLAAPDEADAGVSVNTIDGTVTSFLEVGGTPLTADSDPVDASVLYAHSPTSVTVEKSPSGAQSPGSVIPYSMTFTNDGPTPIYNPVFTDTLPYDADGSILLINPNDIALGVSPYGYTLTGTDPDPAEGAPLPTDPADVTVVEAIDDMPPTIEFSFAGDTALAPGQAYTITMNLIVRPGFPADRDITNTATVEGDRPFDECSGATQDPPADSCSNDTTINLSPGTAIRSGKLVKSDDDELGVMSTVADYTCVPGPDGFYAPPCVPITKPGGTDTWRLALENTGTVNITQLVAVDTLPTPGDTGAINPVQRGSAWTPELLNELPTVAGPGGTYALYGTTDAQPCTDDLTPLSSSCPAGSWTELELSSDLVGLTGLKLEVTFAQSTPLEPGEYVTVDIRTVAPAISPTDGPDTIAWNSVATGGVAQGDTELLPTEGNKVGVALATGPISIEKTVSGDAAGQYAPTTFDVQLVCTSAGDEVYREDYTLTANTPVTVNDLPWGAECEIEEGDNGQWSSTSQTAIVGRDTDPVGEVTLDNDYEYASLDVSKSVVGDGGASWTDPADAGPFLVFVQCQYLGEAVFADGYSASVPMTALLRDSDVLSLENLPAGADCTVTEITAQGADSTTVVATTADGSSTQDGQTTPISLTPDDPGTTNTVEIINQYALGTLTIDKTIAGPGATKFGAGPFVFSVHCVYDRPFPLTDIVTYDGTVSVGGSDPLSTSISGIVTGSVCTVSEIDAGGADTWYLNGVDAQTEVEVTIGDPDPNITINALNYFEDLVSLDVKKIVDPAAQDADGNVPDLGTFPVEVECIYRENTPYVKEVLATGYTSSPMRKELANQEVWTLEGLPSGSTCTATETDTKGADSTTTTATNANETVTTDATVASVTLTENGPLGGTTNHFIFENSFDVGSLTLRKLRDGPGVEDLGAGPFTFHIECSLLTPLPVRSTYSGDITLTEEPWTQTIDGIVAGSLCAITETDVGGADYVEFTNSQGDPTEAHVIIGADAVVTVTATNYFEQLASLEVTKTVADNVQLADGSSPNLGPFPVRVQCVYGDGTLHKKTVYAEGYSQLRPMDVALSPGETVLFEGLPATSDCTVTELSNGGAVGTTTTVTTADVGPDTTEGATAAVVLTPDDPDVTNTVEFVNAYAAGSLEIIKQVTGDGAESLGDGPFSFHIECVLERDVLADATTYTADITLGGDQPLSTTIDGIVAGSECTVTETDAAGADQTTFQPGGGDADEGAMVQIDADATVTVTAVNQFDLPPTPGPDNGGGDLAGTGFDNWGFAWLGGALVLIGGVLLVVRRKRTPEHRDQ